MTADATQDSIRQIFNGALGALVYPDGTSQTASQPFATFKAFAGKSSADQISIATQGATSAVLLALESDLPVKEREVRTLTAGLVAQDLRTTWVVYVVANDARESDATGNTAVTVHTMAAAVVGALDGLFVPGGGDVDCIEYTGEREAIVTQGELYAYALRFTADYPAQMIDPPLTGVPLQEVDISIDLTDAAFTPPDDPDNPLVQTRVTTSDTFPGDPPGDFDDF
jgi:hypothetical protein